MPSTGTDYRDNAMILRRIARYERAHDNIAAATKLFAEAARLERLAHQIDPLPFAPTPTLPLPRAAKKLRKRKPPTFNRFLGRDEAPAPKKRNSR